MPADHENTHAASSGDEQPLSKELDPATAQRGLSFLIEPIIVEDVRPVRLELLRAPGTDPALVVYPHDDDDDTLHLGCKVFDEICAISTVHREPASFNPDLPDAWRLRGVATAPLLRRRGVGRIMMMTCLQHAWELGGQLVWCNARTPAVAFYESLGFLLESDEFEIPGIGPHRVMWRPLDAPRDTA